VPLLHLKPLTDQYTRGIGSSDNDFPLKAYVTILQERHEGKVNNATSDIDTVRV